MPIPYDFGTGHKFISFQDGAAIAVESRLGKAQAISLELFSIPLQLG
jgi:hypothetical protein